MDTNATAAPAVPCRADRPRIYVACLAAYNGGRLHGQWIDATEPDEVREEVRTMLADSPEPDAEEWAIHDHEGFEGCRISEWASFDSVCALADFVEQHGRLGARLYGHFEDNLDEARAAFDNHAASIAPLQTLLKRSRARPVRRFQPRCNTISTGKPWAAISN